MAWVTFDNGLGALIDVALVTFGAGAAVVVVVVGLIGRSFKLQSVIKCHYISRQYENCMHISYL